MVQEIVDMNGEFLPHDQGKDFNNESKDREDQGNVKDNLDVLDPRSDSCDNDHLW